MSVRRHPDRTGTKTAARRCVPLATVLLLTTFIVFAYLPASLASASFSTPENISPGSFATDNEEPQIALDSVGNSHVVWTGYNGTEKIYYSTNAGGSWSDPLLISTTSYENYEPQIAVDPDDHAHVVWTGYDGDSGSDQIWYSTNIGGTWSGPVIVSIEDNWPYNPQIAVDSTDSAHVVWHGHIDEDCAIYYSSNAGGAWSGPELLSTTSSASGSEPDIAVDLDDYVHVVFDGYDFDDEEYYIYYVTNADGWTNPPDILSDESTSDENYGPQIALDSSDTAHVVWSGYDDGTYSEDVIFYTTGIEGSWLTTPDILSPSSYDNYNPRIAVDSGDDPHVVWYGNDDDTGEEVIYYSNNVDSWFPDPNILSPDSDDNYDPQIALDSDGDPSVVWYGHDAVSDEGQIFYSTNYGEGWTDPPDVLSAGSTDNKYPQIAMDMEGGGHVVWRGWGETTYQIYYAAGTEGDWYDQVQVSSSIPANGTNDNWNPDIAVDSNNHPHAAWVGYNGDDQVYYNANLGSGWQTWPTLLSTTSHDNGQPQIAADPNGNAHVVWQGNDDSKDQVYYSTNAGGSWSAPLALSTGVSGSSSEPQIALDAAGKAHVAWVGHDGSNNQIYYSTNAGGSWLASPDRVSNFSHTSNNYNPQIMLDTNGKAHVVWRSFYINSVYNIYYNSNAGGSWLAGPELVSTTTSTSNNYNPQIALDASSHAHVVWEGYSGSYYQIYYNTNAGGSWPEPDTLSTTTNNNYNPQMALDASGHPNVVWYGDDGSYEQVYYSTNAGTAWSAPLLLSSIATGYDNYSPQIAAGSDGHPYVVWQAESNYGYEYEYEYIYYSTNPGTVWSTPLVLSTNSEWNWDPMIAMGPVSQPHVVWAGLDNVATARIWYTADLLNAVTATVAGGHGTAAPAKQYLVDGGSATITLTPDAGYHVGSVTDNGVAVTPTPTTSYTINNVTANHDVVVTYVPDKADWYLAEGSTDGGMETWVLVQNPGAEAVTVDLTLMTESGPKNPDGLQGVTIPAFSRTSFSLGSFVTTYDVSTMVNANGGDVVCERAVYGNSRTWGTDSIGATAPAATWYLAEGSTGGGMETYVLVQNPNTSAVSVDLNFMTSGGQVPGPEGFRVPAGTRITFLASDYVTDYDVSTVVTSTGGGIVCERSVYGADRTWGTDSIGATAPAATWYLAEGSTGGDMETWVLVQNPGTVDVTVDLTFMTSAGTVPGPQGFVIPAGTRHSFNVGEMVTDFDVSTLVEASGGVVCERAMYGGERTWATDSIGATTPAAAWYMAEGSTDGGMETWVLVQNPGAADVTVDLTYMTPGGEVPGPQGFVIPAGTRHSFNVGETVTDYNVSTMVQATGGVVCERAMYGPDRVWATDSIGFAP